jgi:hypothetical protein
MPGPGRYLPEMHAYRVISRGREGAFLHSAKASR